MACQGSIVTYAPFICSERQAWETHECEAKDKWSLCLDYLGSVLRARRSPLCNPKVGQGTQPPTICQVFKQAFKTVHPNRIGLSKADDFSMYVSDRNKVSAGGPAWAPRHRARSMMNSSRSERAHLWWARVYGDLGVLYVCLGLGIARTAYRRDLGRTREVPL